MEAAKKRLVTRKRKKAHIRKRISGEEDCLRISVFRSLKHIHAQAIDDTGGNTIASVSSLDKDVKEKIDGFTGNKKAANVAGKILGEKLVEKGHKKIIFDRNGFLYHGRVKSLADGMREAGLKF